MLYEERFTNLKRGALRDYLAWTRGEGRARVSNQGGRAVCLMTGLIGSEATEVLQVTAYPDFDAWQRLQSAPAGPRSELVEHEDVRILRAIAARPKESLPEDDRRAVYGYRRFFIHGADLDEFVHCSGDGVWPRIEAQGACILGLWTTVAATEPREVVLLTGYHGPGHWEETRGNLPMPAGFDKALWDQGQRLGSRRNELTLRSWVKLLRAVELDEKPVG